MAYWVELMLVGLESCAQALVPAAWLEMLCQQEVLNPHQPILLIQVHSSILA